MPSRLPFPTRKLRKQKRHREEKPFLLEKLTFFCGKTSSGELKETDRKEMGDATFSPSSEYFEQLHTFLPVK